MPRRPGKPAPSKAGLGSGRSIAAAFRRRVRGTRPAGASRISESPRPSRNCGTSVRSVPKVPRVRQHQGSGGCSRRSTSNCADPASSLRASPRKCCPHQAPRRRQARSCGLRDGRWPSRGRARSPAPARRTASAPRRARPSRWKNRHRRHLWCARDNSVRPYSRENSRAFLLSACPADTGLRENMARRAVSPQPGRPAAGCGNKAPS